MVHFKTCLSAASFLLTAAFSANAAEKSTMYKLSPDEIHSFLARKRVYDPSYQPFKPSTNGSLSDDTVSLADTTLDCVSHNKEYETHGIRYGFQSASCEWAGTNAKYFVTCAEFKVTITPPGVPREVISEGDSKTFPHYCKETEVCMNTLAGVFLDHQSGEQGDDIECVNALDVPKVEFSAVQEKGRQQCSSSYQVPGAQYSATYSTGVTNFVLTADVTWSNGKPYKAPSMFIRDESAKHPFDRAFRLNTDVVSATMSVGSYRGRLQSRLIRFCFEQLTGGHSWAVLAVTWFKAPSHRRGRRIGFEAFSSTANITSKRSHAWPCSESFIIKWPATY